MFVCLCSAGVVSITHVYTNIKVGRGKRYVNMYMNDHMPTAPQGTEEEQATEQGLYLDLLSLRLLSVLEAALVFFRAVAGDAGCLWDGGA